MQKCGPKCLTKVQVENDETTGSETRPEKREHVDLSNMTELLLIKTKLLKKKKNRTEISLPRVLVEHFCNI